MPRPTWRPDDNRRRGKTGTSKPSGTRHVPGRHPLACPSGAQPARRHVTKQQTCPIHLGYIRVMEGDPASGPDSAGGDSELMGAVGRLVRGGWDELESSMVVHGGAAGVPGSKATLRCHFIRSGPNGAPRVDVLAQQLADQIVHYCIPRSELLKAQSLSSDRQVAAITRLAREASRLFTQSQLLTGEGAELLLYAQLEKGLAIPQVLSKMSLKTSTEMQVHGADGVHAKILDNGDLAIYWGEAKLYDTVADAMTSCLDSLGPYLTGTAQKQDVFLIQHFTDTGNQELTARILEYFDDGSLKSADVEMRGACLIGFSFENYPKLPRELAQAQVRLDTALEGWVRSMSTRIKNRSLCDFEIEVFFVPVPSAPAFRTAIKRALGVAA